MREPHAIVTNATRARDLRIDSLQRWLQDHRLRVRLGPATLVRVRRGLADLAKQSSAIGRDESIHLTTSILVVARCTGKVALVAHERLACWVAPGGHVEKGDSTLEDAALRELREEASICLHKRDVLGAWDIDVHCIPECPRFESHAHIDVRLLAVIEGGALIARDGVTDARWFGAADWRQVSVSRTLRRALQNLESARLLR